MEKRTCLVGLTLVSQNEMEEEDELKVNGKVYFHRTPENQTQFSVRLDPEQSLMMLLP